VGLIAQAGCDPVLPGQLAGCRLYRPHLAKRTFDGRVGAVLLRNAGTREIEVKLYHPDGIGDVELRRRVPPGTTMALEGDEGVRLALGNDWGIQVDHSCVTTLGQTGEWAPGEFPVRWDGGRLRAGLDRGP
jgi:hypothetical protein